MVDFKEKPFAKALRFVKAGSASASGLQGPRSLLKDHSKVDVLIVGPIPPPRSYVGGIAVMIQMQLALWELPASVAHLNTDLWSRDKGTAGKFRFKHILAFFLNGMRLTWIILQRRPALVHYHSSVRLGLLKDTILAWWARWACHRLVVLHIHFAVLEAILLPGPVTWRRLQLRFILAASDRVAFLSHGVVADTARLLPAKDRARLHAKAVILREFTELPERRPEPRSGETPINILFIGNIGPLKGAYDLVRATRYLAQGCSTPFRVLLAGPFDSREHEERITGMAREEGLCDFIRFLGPVKGQAKTQAFLDADIFTLPSHGEGVPVAMLEAMSYGVPVVVTDVGGIPEAVTDGREGLIVRPGQIEALAAALIRLIRDPGLRRQMGEAGRARVEKSHTDSAYFKALDKLYRDLSVLPGASGAAKPMRP